MTSAALVYAANVENPWPGFRNPAPGPARSIGEYSAGCLQGAQALPLDGPGYQVMRPSRRRYYGHPALIDFVRLLGRRVQNQKLGTLLVGDLSQVRGGRSSNGHASHQTGLDVDVWYAHPPAARKKLSMQAREDLQAEDVVDLKRQLIVPRWKKHVAHVLRLVADDTHVERVFVNPVIKSALCEAPAESRGWLRKIRPWYGHADHFHVRLACLPSDGDCKGQAPLAPGDGCDKLGSWLRTKRPGPVSPVARKPVGSKSGPPKALVEYRKAIAEGHGWPEQCNALLEPELPETGRLASSGAP